MDSIISRLPKIAPTVGARVRLQSWLEFHADVPLRYVCASAGSGKTTVAVMYARSRSTAVGYLSIRPQTTAPDLYARIGEASGAVGISDYQQLLRHLSGVPRLELIVDDIDNASVAVRDVLQHLYKDAVESVTFIYLGRSPEAVSLAAGAAQGLVATCDPGWLSFRTDEIALFAQGLGLNEDPLTIARLQRGTQGWAFAIAGACRGAAGSSERLRDAWPRWRRGAQGLLAEMILDALRSVPADIADAFHGLLSGQICADQELLRLFARYGLFIHEHDGHLTLNPLIGSDAGTEAAGPDGHLEGSATLEMFGRFEFNVDGKTVKWQRRRDRQIVSYLALQPYGRATRAQLIATFWPDADRQLAAQSLRTACSTIRRALGNCVGPANVGRFFVADHLVELKLHALRSSVAGFASHMADADRAYHAGDLRAAFLSYTAARTLYAAPLLAGEPPMDWSKPHAARLAEMKVRCSERLAILANPVEAITAPGRPMYAQAGHVL